MSDVTVTVTQDVTSVTTSQTVNPITVTEDVTSVSVSAVPPSATNASSVGVTPYNTITATNIQEALEQLADQFFRSASAPTGDSLSEGDLWYDTDDDQLYVYRETSTNVFEFVPLAAATDTMDNLDGGLF
jgi:hypothetical protein